MFPLGLKNKQTRHLPNTSANNEVEHTTINRSAETTPSSSATASPKTLTNQQQYTPSLKSPVTPFSPLTATQNRKNTKREQNRLRRINKRKSSLITTKRKNLGFTPVRRGQKKTKKQNYYYQPRLYLQWRVCGGVEWGRWSRYSRRSWWRGLGRQL